MNIQLKKLSLTNFKGIRSLNIDFDAVTDIRGDNGTGKTTVFDAFLWLLFGKDSTDRKDFEIKTLDENNQPYHRLDHEVEAFLLVDGVEHLVKRSLRERWSKTRGSSKEEFKGHETTYFWNDVPLKQEDFQRKVSEIVPESVFKLITNTNYFNSLKWQDRRQTLLQIAGEIDETSIITTLDIDPEQREKLLAAFRQGKGKDNFKEYRSELYNKKKKIKDELLLIPSRIDEANRSLPDAVDAGQIELKIASFKKAIADIDAQLFDKSEAERTYQEEKTNKVRAVGALKQEAAKIEMAINQKVIDHRNARESEIADMRSQLRQKSSEVARMGSDINYNNSQKANLEQRQSALRQQWNKINEEQLPPFDDKDCKCPTCKRLFDGVDVEVKKVEFLANFNADKAKRLTGIKDQGIALGNEIAGIDTKIKDLEASRSVVEKEVVVLTERVAQYETNHLHLTADEKSLVTKETLESADLKRIAGQIKALEDEISQPAAEVDNSELIAKKLEHQRALEENQRTLSTVTIRESGLKRIGELETSERTMNQELADYEAIEYGIELFTRAKMDELVNRINGKFSMVTFKLFEEQINGGTSETCQTLINGVPYSDANTASKINAGIDIINTLSKHYGVTAPIFIDNAESIVNIMPTESQLIRLIVSADHKKLTVSTASMAMAV